MLNKSIQKVSIFYLRLAIKNCSMRCMQYRLKNAQEQRGAKPKDEEMEKQNIEIYSTLLSVVSTEVLFYPFETIMHRLQLQGTRTIIDNLDSGYSVVPILTSYEGATDCYRTTIATEGVSGLYKGKIIIQKICAFHYCKISHFSGFGAMVLQFAAHIAVIKLTKWIVTQVMDMVANKPPAKVTEFYNLETSLKSSPAEGDDFTREAESNTISKSISSLSVE